MQFGKNQFWELPELILNSAYFIVVLCTVQGKMVRSYETGCYNSKTFNGSERVRHSNDNVG